MSDWQERTRRTLGDVAVERLNASSVILFGVGGVGGYTAEALARAGVGKITLVDKDVVDETNRNRQLVALCSTVGRAKVEVMRERILDIHPGCVVDARQVFYLPENADEFDFSQYDYVIDAVDTVAAKIAIIERSVAAGAPVVSCMGAGNKTDPTRFRLAPISQTSVCPLAKVMRRELKKRGIENVKCVYSDEPPMVSPDAEKGRAPGSLAFSVGTAGLLLASAVVCDLTAI